MNEQNPSENPSSENVTEVMKRVSAVTHLFELDEIQFVRCAFGFEPGSDEMKQIMDIRFAVVNVQLESDSLKVCLGFQFSAPNPLADEDDQNHESVMRVEISADLLVTYALEDKDADYLLANAEDFGRVNGVYNSWPYLREFVRSSLVRLGLPPFDLPLLRVGSAVVLAGVVKAPFESADEATGQKTDN